MFLILEIVALMSLSWLSGAFTAIAVVGIVLGLVSWGAPRVGGLLFLLLGLPPAALLGLFGAAFSQDISPTQGILGGVILFGWPAAIPGALFIAVGVREARMVRSSGGDTVPWVFHDGLWWRKDRDRWCWRNDLETEWYPYDPERDDLAPPRTER